MVQVKTSAMRLFYYKKLVMKRKGCLIIVYADFTCSKSCTNLICLRTGTGISRICGSRIYHRDN